MILTPFERLVLWALWLIIAQRGGKLDEVMANEIDLAIRTSDDQQRADEAQKRQIP